MSTAVSIIRRQGEGERMWFAGGGVITWKATAEETGGAFLMFEDRMERGKVTPLHTHPDQDEAIYVLEGEIALTAGGRELLAQAGSWLQVPPGVPHAVSFPGSEPARLLNLHTPNCGFGAFLRALRDAGDEQAATARAGFDRQPAA